MVEVTMETQTMLAPAAIVAQVAAALGVPLEGGDGLIKLPQAIEPTAVYDETTSGVVTGTSQTTRWRAVKDGRLVCRRVGARRYYLGSDLLSWLKGEKGGRKQ